MEGLFSSSTHCVVCYRYLSARRSRVEFLRRRPAVYRGTRGFRAQSVSRFSCLSPSFLLPLLSTLRRAFLPFLYGWWCQLAPPDVLLPSQQNWYCLLPEEIEWLWSLPLLTAGAPPRSSPSLCAYVQTWFLSEEICWHSREPQSRRWRIFCRRFFSSSSRSIFSVRLRGVLSLKKDRPRKKRQIQQTRRTLILQRAEERDEEKKRENKPTTKKKKKQERRKERLQVARAMWLVYRTEEKKTGTW